MHGEEAGSPWGTAAADAIRNIWSVGPLTNKDRRQFRREREAEANKAEKVFTKPVRGRQIRWVEGVLGMLAPKGNADHGWRENPDGSRTEVRFYDGEGWLSHDELFDLRQKHPRIAP